MVQGEAGSLTAPAARPRHANRSGSPSLDSQLSSASWLKRLLARGTSRRQRGHRIGSGSGSSGASVWGSGSATSTDPSSARLGSGSSGGVSSGMGGTGGSAFGSGPPGLEDVPETKAVVHGAKGVLLVQVRVQLGVGRAEAWQRQGQGGQGKGRAVHPRSCMC